MGCSRDCRVETVAQLDPAGGTQRSRKSYAYYLPGQIMLTCGVSTSTVDYYDNANTGLRYKRVMTATVVAMTTAPSPRRASNRYDRRRGSNSRH